MLVSGEPNTMSWEVVFYDLTSAHSVQWCFLQCCSLLLIFPETTCPDPPSFSIIVSWASLEADSRKEFSMMNIY